MPVAVLHTVNSFQARRVAGLHAQHAASIAPGVRSRLDHAYSALPPPSVPEERRQLDQPRRTSASLGILISRINCNRSNRLDSLCINLEFLCICLFLGQILFYSRIDGYYLYRVLLKMRDYSLLLLLVFYFGRISLFLIDANCNCLLDLMKITQAPSICHVL